MEVALIDENDKIVGFMDKIDAHIAGLLHRAYSMFVFNDQGQVLIQQRALKKYHSSGLWSNSFCSHFYKGEDEGVAINRGAKDELGIQMMDYDKIGQINYRAEVGSGMTEYELDYVYLGKAFGAVQINPEEVMDYKWIDFKKLCESVKTNPDLYSEWLKIILNDKSLKSKMMNTIYGG